MLSTIVIAFAVGYSLYAWRHGELFSPIVSWLGDHGLTGKMQSLVVWLRIAKDPSKGGDPTKSRVFRLVTAICEKLTYLALCPFCLAFWFSLIFSVVMGKLELSGYGLLVDVLASAAGGYWIYQMIHGTDNRPRAQP